MRLCRNDISRAILLLAAGALMSACSVNGSISNLTSVTTTQVVGNLQGITSGGAIQTTSGGYQVQSTVGSPIATIVTTTSSGYTVYSNVAGDMASDSTVTTTQ